MWLDSPQTLRDQIRDDIRQHSTPAGCVATYQTARRLSHPERQDIPAGNDAQRDDETELS
jgi:hypothetical protein